MGSLFSAFPAALFPSHLHLSLLLSASQTIKVACLKFSQRLLFLGGGVT